MSPRERRGNERPRERDQQEAGVERVRARPCRPRCCARSARHRRCGQRDREHAVGVVADGDVAEPPDWPPCCASLPVGRVDREATAGPMIDESTLPLRVEDLRDRVGIGERGTGFGPRAVVGVVAPPFAGNSRAAVCVNRVERCKEECVGLGAELAARAQVGRVRAADDDECERDGDDEREPEAQAHAGRGGYSRRRGRSGSAAARRRPRSCAGGSRCRRRATSTTSRTRSPRCARRWCRGSRRCSAFTSRSSRRSNSVFVSPSSRVPRHAWRRCGSSERSPTREHLGCSPLMLVRRNSARSRASSSSSANGFTR